MKIWHSGAHWSPHAVNGVNALIYSLAREQAALGHDVSLLLTHSPDPAAVEYTSGTGVRLLPSAALVPQLESDPPDIVHMHSVYIPQQAMLAAKLVRHRIPYIITPNGGLAPRILARNRLKKAVYNQLIEKRRFRRAACISAVTPYEEEEIRSFVPGFQGFIPCVPNSVSEPDQLEAGAPWAPENSVAKLVYLGRFEVEHKGIDILLELARELEGVELHLFGSEDARTLPWLNSLKQSCSANTFFHGPVFGREKSSVMAGASLYIQTSRWEAFGISIAEAMYLGLPCAISDSLHMARWFQSYDLGLVLPQNPDQARRDLLEALRNKDRLRQWSGRAKDFARRNFHPRPVAARFLECYERSLAA
jgi:glycosyltransferase involved in cell wall biosynthesis